MADNYWTNKRQNAGYAREVSSYMRTTYETQTTASIASTMELDATNVIDGKFAVEKKSGLPGVVFSHNTSTAEIFNTEENAKIAVLNFASFRNPGGKFLAGSSAQEESLCQRSNLFNVLSDKKDWYSENNKTYLNNYLYADRGLYTPDVVFENPGLSFNSRMRNSMVTSATEEPVGKVRTCDVYTVAAPNARASKAKDVSREEVTKALVSRIKFVLNSIFTVCEEKGIKYDKIIFGAFGCGVFGNNPETVAGTFYDALLEMDYEKYATQIVFAVPRGILYNINAVIFERELAKRQPEETPVTEPVAEDVKETTDGTTTEETPAEAE